MRTGLPLTVLLACGLMLAGCDGGGTEPAVAEVDPVVTSPTPQPAAEQGDDGEQAAGDGTVDDQAVSQVDDGIDYGDLPLPDPSSPPAAEEPDPTPTPTPESESESAEGEDGAVEVEEDPEPDPGATPDDGSEPTPEPSGEPEPTAGPCDREPTDWGVVGTNFAFDVTSLPQVCSGDTITLTNTEGTHSLTGGGYDTGLFPQDGAARSITITGGPTTFSYACTLHPNMRGSATVVG